VSVLERSVLDLLRVMEEQRASDIYLKAGSPPMYRIDGEVRPGAHPPLTAADVDRLAAQLMNGRDQERFTAEQSVDLAYSARDVGRFRVNIYRQRGTIAVVARRVRQDVPTLEELHLPAVLADLAMAPRGLILVTGPAGSGKSTTLAAMIDRRNEAARTHIVTIEDPIEFLHADKMGIVSQREVSTDTPGFHEALRAALRQTPDVLLIGEMRDRESAEAALYFAETGHLVLSTLHSVNASQAVERMLAFFPPDHALEVFHRLSLTIAGIIAQRLIPRSDGTGRVAALEVLTATPRIRELVKRGDIDAIRHTLQAGRPEGMQTFDQALYDLAKAGLISEADALRYADSANDLKLRFKGLG
jgi:twitching motility protein PilU